MATVASHSSPATEAAFGRLDAAIADAVAGRRRYPDGTAFVPADTEDLPGALRRHLADGRPAVVLVFSDGAEMLIRRRQSPWRRLLDGLSPKPTA
jgi:hypothetical protein